MSDVPRMVPAYDSVRSGSFHPQEQPSMSTLTLADAALIVDKALEHGRARNLKPLTVAVLDAGGHLVAFKREDNSGILRFDIPDGKARGVLGVGFGSRT